MRVRYNMEKIFWTVFLAAIPLICLWVVIDVPGWMAERRIARAAQRRQEIWFEQKQQTVPQPKSSALWLAVLYDFYGQTDQAIAICEKVIRQGGDAGDAALAESLLARIKNRQASGGVQAGRNDAADFAMPVPAQERGPAAPQVPAYGKRSSAESALSIAGQTASRIRFPGEGLETTEMADSPSVEMELPAVEWLEKIVPQFVEVTAQQLSAYMTAVGEEQVTRVYTEKEFQQVVTDTVLARMGGRMADASIGMSPDGIRGTVVLLLEEGAPVRLSSWMDLQLQSGRPKVVVREIRVEEEAIPDDIAKTVEWRVNQIMERQRYPVRFTQMQIRRGSMLVCAELG